MRKCYCYQLKLEDVISHGLNKKRVKKEVHFDPIVNKSGLSKLYVVKANKEFVYVGIARQGMSARLRYGLHPSGQHISHGYHGYQWKHLKSVEIYVWLYPENKKRLDVVESVEAELVFLIRKNTGAWPKYQTEIHFHQPSGKIIKEAQEIFDFLKSK